MKRKGERKRGRKRVRERKSERESQRENRGSEVEEGREGGNVGKSGKFRQI